ncbi:hypothetical protein D9M73_134540 [compost metagenome]
MLDIDRPQALGPLERLDLRTVQDDFGAPTELQQITGIEIDEQQPGPGIEQQVAQGIEMQVAGEIRNGQAIAFHLYETGLTAAVRNIHRAFTVDVHITGNEKGVRLGDHGFARVIQFAEMLGGTGRRIGQRHRAKLAQLNVLRAIAEGLVHRHRETIHGHGTDMPIDAVAAAGVQLDAQQSDGRAFAQLRGIIKSRQTAKLQQARFWRMCETGLAFKDTGPGMTVGIHRCVQHERQLLIEGAVLVRHLAANHLTTERLHSFGNAHMRLQLFLAGMPG